MKRLQGTDGVRGRVLKSSECPTNDPVECFLKYNVLTETFFELYGYCFAQELLAGGLAGFQDRVVIGWDPRDLEGSFNDATVRGVRKAGLDVITVGVLPTPAVGLYMHICDAIAAMVLTASHNPSDQNGIKIFLGKTGLKFFPADDVRLTKRILEIDFSMLASLPMLGRNEDHHEVATKRFIEFSLDKSNSWLPVEEFLDSIVVVDASNGAYSLMVKLLFEKLGFKEVIFTNCDPMQGINVKCGVADLEGSTVIPSSSVDSPEGKFSEYSTLKTLLELGRMHKNELRSGRLFCTGIVFDGDGDRFYRLDFDPYTEEIIISGGDKLAFFQTQFLMKTRDWEGKDPIFVNTVESDLEASRAILLLNVDPVQAAVGDKWILWQAFKEDWNARSQVILNQVSDESFKRKILQFSQLFDELEEQSNFDAMKLTKGFLELEKLFAMDERGEDKSLFDRPVRSRFLIGSEESGHIVTQGVLKKRVSETSVFIGNGLKSALNSFSAIRFLKPVDVTSYYRWLMAPFAPGFQKSMPVYYVDKTLLEPGTEFRSNLRKYILRTLKQKLPGKNSQELPRLEEPQMLYILITKEQDLVASLFIRNSGTEDKMSLYLRGRLQDQMQLVDLADIVYRYLLIRVKNRSNLFAKAELSILQQLAKGALSFDEISFPTDLASSKERIFHEMSAKQSLISHTKKGWALSEFGKELLDSE